MKGLTALQSSPKTLGAPTTSMRFVAKVRVRVRVRVTYPNPK